LATLRTSKNSPENVGSSKRCFNFEESNVYTILVPGGANVANLSGCCFLDVAQTPNSSSDILMSIRNEVLSSEYNSKLYQFLFLKFPTLLRVSCSCPLKSSHYAIDTRNQKHSGGNAAFASCQQDNVLNKVAWHLHCRQKCTNDQTAETE
jgi:hypothetical protein